MYIFPNPYFITVDTRKTLISIKMKKIIVNILCELKLIFVFPVLVMLLIVIFFLAVTNIADSRKYFLYYISDKITKEETKKINDSIVFYVTHLSCIFYILILLFYTIRN